MQRGTAGFLGGIAGGLIKLALDQAALAANISSVDTIGVLSRLMFPAARISQPAGWVLFLLAAGAAGWLVAKMLAVRFPRSYLFSGIFIGTVLWGLMGAALLATGTTAPNRELGLSSLVVNLFTSLVLGVIFTYTLSRQRAGAVYRKRKI